MKHVYIVMGSSGSYSEQSEWPVMAYSKASDAQTHVDQAQSRGLEITEEIYAVEERGKGFYARKEELLRTNEFDPDMEGTIFEDESGYYLLEVKFKA